MDRVREFETIIKESINLGAGEMGDSFEEMTMSEFIVQTIYTVFIAIVLLNLVIAIMSDRYEVVVESKQQSEAKETLRKCIEIERILMILFNLIQSF